MSQVPEIPEIDLPVRPRLREIINSLGQCPALVLRAEPGAGKTSLVPLALARAWPKDGKVIVLEPRRIAAVQSAFRVAELLGELPGGSVGYRVRGDSRSGALIEFVTEGVFLRMIQSDPSLEGVGSLVFDEFHERSIQADLGLALALEARDAFRPGLRLVLMSATMEVGRLADFIQGCSLEITGRSYAVRTEHIAVVDGPGFYKAIACMSLDYMARLAGGEKSDVPRGAGNLLAFLPGVAEIEIVARHIRESGTRGIPEVLVLHGGLALEQQRRVISPPNFPRGQKIILATSIAETSLTVPGISAVLDSGLARLTRFEVRSGLNRLVTERESRDRADQRRGRAGRLGPGTCLRAWTESEPLPETTQPEILRAELSGLVLEAIAWGARDAGDLRWLDPPPSGAWEAAKDLLSELGALGDNDKPSPLGQACLKMGTEPRLGALVLQGDSEGRLREAAGLAALLTERSGSEANLELCLEALNSGRPDMASAKIEAARLEKAALSSGWNAAGKPARDTRGSIGSLLAAGFPDRVAKRLEFSGGKAIFQLPGGRKLVARGGLAESGWIVAAEAEAGGGAFAKTGEGRIFSGATLSEEEALTALSPVLIEKQRIDWEGLIPRARAVRMAGSIVLSERSLGSPSREVLISGFVERLGKEGLGILPWEGGGGAELLGRMRWYVDRKDSSKTGWPSLSNTDLLESIQTWLLPFIEAGNSGPCLSASSLRKALSSLIPPGQQSTFEREAPESFSLPSGRNVRLEYDKDQLGPGGSKIGPALEARPQDLYGLRIHPTVLGFPILVKLLSPAGRPIHLTTDIPGFWKGSWTEVRKDLKGRYPKHDWPEDPLWARPGSPGRGKSHGK